MATGCKEFQEKGNRQVEEIRKELSEQIKNHLNFMSSSQESYEETEDYPYDSCEDDNKGPYRGC